MNNLKDFIKTLNILYVEDEVSAREIFTKILKRFFNTVDARENGLEGYIAFKEKHLKNEKYDLIISDINMPKLDGMEMLEKIREIDSLVPVVFITARHEADVLLKAIELQISDFIIKPIDFDGITKVVNNASEKLFLKNTLLRKNTELELYLKTIEQMAFIIKMDMDLNITYINDIFSNSIDCETSNIIGQNFDFLKSKLSFLSQYGVSFDGWLINITGNFETVIWIIIAFILILFFKNSMEKWKEFKLNYKTLILTFICLTAGLLSLNKVSEFLYFNF